MIKYSESPITFHNKSQRVSVSGNAEQDAAPAASLRDTAASAQTKEVEIFRPQAYSATQRFRAIYNIVRDSPWYHRLFFVGVIFQVIVLTIDRVVRMQRGTRKSTQCPP
jgi:hypothetical protein